MSHDAFINETLRKTLVFDKKTSVFRIGSTMPFHAQLSDVDLLLVSLCRSLKDYADQLDLVMRLSEELNQGNEHFDVFFLTRMIAPLHLRCLSVLVGLNSINNKNVVFGPTIKYSEFDHTLTDEETRRKIYRAATVQFSRECRSRLPVADTGQARNVAKLVMRLLKSYMCATSPVGRLDATEQRLLEMKDLQEVALMSGITMPRVLGDALRGNDIDDWPCWMIAQEELVYGIADIEQKVLFRNHEEWRLFEEIVQVREMLFSQLRNIIAAQAGAREELISDFADRTSSCAVRLGLAGVSELLDFTTVSTDQIIKDSYSILVEHLQKSRPDIECLAASIVMLEYAFMRSVAYGCSLSAENIVK